VQEAWALMPYIEIFHAWEVRQQQLLSVSCYARFSGILPSNIAGNR